MHSLGLVKDIPVMIQNRVMPMDLVVVPLKNHKVILGRTDLGRIGPPWIVTGEGCSSRVGVDPRSGSMVLGRPLVA